MSTWCETLRCSLEELDEMIINEVAQHPLTPDHIVALSSEVEVLEASTVQCPHSLIATQIVPSLLQEVFVLLHQVHCAEVFGQEMFGDPPDTSSTIQSSLTTRSRPIITWLQQHLQELVRTINVSVRYLSKAPQHPINSWSDTLPVVSSSGVVLCVCTIKLLTHIHYLHHHSLQI